MTGSARKSTLKCNARKNAHRPVRFSRVDGHRRELIDRNSREVVYIINERIYHLYLRELAVLLQRTYCMNGSSGDSPLDPAEPRPVAVRGGSASLDVIKSSFVYA